MPQPLATTLLTSCALCHVVQINKRSQRSSEVITYSRFQLFCLRPGTDVLETVLKGPQASVSLYHNICISAFCRLTLF